MHKTAMVGGWLGACGFLNKSGGFHQGPLAVVRTSGRGGLEAEIIVQEEGVKWERGNP